MLSNQAITDIVLEHMDASRKKAPVAEEEELFNFTTITDNETGIVIGKIYNFIDFVEYYKKHNKPDSLTPAIALKYIRLIEECAYRDAGTMSDKFARLATNIENRFIQRYM